jgi:hypothetical protein
MRVAMTSSMTMIPSTSSSASTRSSRCDARAASRGLRRAALSSTGDDFEDARREALLAALPSDATFTAFVEHAFTLAGDDAGMLVQAFCDSERLTLEFCEQAFECAYGAYTRGAPEEETQTYVTLARIFMSNFRSRVQPPEASLIDDIVDEARRRLAAAPDADDVVRVRDDIRHILADKFASPNLDENIFITRLRSFRVKLSLDDKRKVSFATEFFEADESGVAAILDPMIELNTSARTRAELIDAVDCVLDAVRALYEDIPGAR